jgi:glucuronate isomerase
LNDEEKERFQQFRKENPKKHPGPTYYWKTKTLGKDFKIEKSKKMLETVINDNGTKTFYIERSVTDKIVSRPMSSHIF